MLYFKIEGIHNINYNLIFLQFKQNGRKINRFKKLYKLKVRFEKKNITYVNLDHEYIN